MNVLPPMRREILFEVLKIVFLSSALSLFLIISIYFSGKNPKNAFYINYKSMNYLLIMSDNWDSIFLAKNHFIEIKKKEIDDFENSLIYLEKGSENIDSLKKIRTLFDKYKLMDKKVEYNEYIKIREILNKLIQNYQVLSEKIISDRESFATKILILSCFVFFISLIISIYFSEKISARIASPIKKISDILRNKPLLGQKLKFPQPENLEIKNLIFELNDLWKRLSEMNNLNLKSLTAQRNELDAVFDLIEDGVFILDHVGKIEHHNKVFANIIGVKSNHLNFQFWNDVSVSSLSYLQLRDHLRKENGDESLFWAFVDNADRIFSVKKQYIYDGNKNRSGTIHVLREMNRFLPAENFSEIVLKLKDSQSK